MDDLIPRRPRPGLRMLKAPVVLLATGVVLAVVLFFGTRYYWGSVADRVMLEADTTRFDEAPVFITSIPLGRDGQVYRPYCLAESGDSLFVVYAEQSFIDIYDRDFQQLSSIHLEGLEGGLISALAVDNNTLYVADLRGKEIRVHRRGGEFIESYKWLPDAATRIVPHALALRDGILYVTDVANRRLHAISISPIPGLREQGELLFSTAPGSGGKAGFEYPSCVAVTPDGRMLISDLSAGAVYVFGCDGRFGGTFISAAPPAKFAPAGIAFDNLPSPSLLEQSKKSFDPSGLLQQGRVHVVDRSSRSVRVFDATGKAVLSYGADRLGIPNGILIQVARRLIFIADTQQGCLFVYKY